MMQRHYRFAGVEITVSMDAAQFYQDEGRLAPFAAAPGKDPHVFRVETVELLEPPAGSCIALEPGFRVYRDGESSVRYIGSVEQSAAGAYIRAVHRGRDHLVQVVSSNIRQRISPRTVLGAMEAEHLVAQAGGFIFHCSFVEWAGRAILFTAPSQTGKSTQAELWRLHRGAQIINGDRAAVRIVNGTAMAEGIPFAGSSDHCLNRSLSIAAVVYLDQAPVTSIRRMRGAEAFVRIWEGASVNTWDKTDVELVSEAVRQIASAVPVYHLPCTPDVSAVTALENVLKSR